MEAQETGQLKNPLESAPLGALILKYSLPAIASSLVNSIYNVVDQIFVGNSVGELGNAATNVVFPLVLIVVALAMTFGVGGASAFSLYLGSKEEQKAKSVAGTSLTLTLLTGVVLAVLTLLFLRPILTAFGGRGQTLEYAIEYTRIVAFGTPLAMLGTGASQLIRADGSPRYAMLSTTLGAVLNAVLDPILIFGFDLGMSGAAWATVIGRLVSSVLILRYFWALSVCHPGEAGLSAQEKQRAADSEDRHCRRGHAVCQHGDQHCHEQCAGVLRGAVALRPGYSPGLRGNYHEGSRPV